VQHLVAAQAQRLHDPRIRLAAIPELLESQTIVVILVHLVENLIDSLLRRVLVLGGWLLTLLTRERERKNENILAAAAVNRAQ
jgi:hypothetical protein